MMKNLFKEKVLLSIHHNLKFRTLMMKKTSKVLEILSFKPKEKFKEK